MNKKFLRIIAITLVFVLLVGCGGGAQTGDAQQDGTEKKRIALLTDRVGTQVFILSMVEGMNSSAEKYDFEVIISESGDAAAFEDNARALVLDEGVDLLIGGGWLAGEAIQKMATEFPDKADYALIDSMVEAENVKCISYREQEGAYLIGLIAAAVADEGEDTFGSIHVNQGPGSWKWRYGYMEGVKTKYPDAKFVFNYVGDYNDPAKAKEFAIQQFEQGASFINAAAAGGDKGVFEAALEKEFYTSGQDVDLTDPNNIYIVSSQMKDTKATVEVLLDEYFIEGAWNTDNEVWGISEGTIGAVHITHESPNPVSERLSEEELEAIKKVAEDIKNGTLDFTNIPNEEDYK
ncbi:MAG: BMP family ABC transporter substrate-binding protein [Tissierellia bacterium]|jgi:basic membrane protein A|nr:BMP family ABC transporter substrate-binding protein [Tissierellia bacterium]